MLLVPVCALEDVEDGGDAVIRPERGQEMSPVCSAANSQLILSGQAGSIGQPCPAWPNQFSAWAAWTGRGGPRAASMAEREPRVSQCMRHIICIMDLHAMRDENRVVCMCSQAQVHTCHGLMIGCLNNESKSECINIALLLSLMFHFDCFCEIL